jgi:hypothetical protein
MATDTLFKAAGVSITNGVVKFHVSRDTKNKEMFVVMDGETRFIHKVLPEAMTKLDAAKYLASLTASTFNTVEIQDALAKVVAEKPAPAPKAPKAAKVPAAPKVTKPKTAAADVMKAAVAPASVDKAARLAMIKAAAAKRNTK